MTIVRTLGSHPKIINRPVGLTSDQHAYSGLAARLYTEQGLSFRRISKQIYQDYGVYICASTIANLLKRRGVSTSKAEGAKRRVTCRNCGSEFVIPRSKHRSSRGVHLRGKARPHNPWNHYCTWTCRRVWLEEHCRGQKEARRMVEAMMGAPLPPSAVVHFIDDDTTNVIKHNIRVFTSTDRHLEEHRQQGY